ncbi:SapC family protein [Rhodoferax sp. AJA081-3]|uniref:SapC family protein n=1 Tax=Rhodoferax sp. AJA081-3 TaxID=2752316 RepID=UPI001ADEC051|nr:SapC family protein [Rhodoferax sp. AJA081-3]QTN28176.1 SapC family protein [Rhodoferax sp. AJA081-3]
MSLPVLLNNVDHKDLRIITTRSARYGDNVMTALSFPHEFRNLQAHYPIVFFKSEDGTGFHSAALLGFQEGENLFLEAGGWDAAYVPLTLARQPFLIGNVKGEMLLHVDLDSPKVSRTEGEPAFLEYGGNTDYLEQVSSMLRAIHDGLEQAPAFGAALQEFNLLESFVFDVELPDGTQHRLAGCYTINEERLQALDGAALEQLSRAGFLQPIYMVIASLSNLRALAERKRRAHVAASR